MLWASQYAHFTAFTGNRESIRLARILPDGHFMQITISYPGFDVQGVVLSASGNRLRVAIKDWDDAAEFLCRDGQWFAENGDAIQVNWPDSLSIISTDWLCDLSRPQSPSPAWVN